MCEDCDPFVTEAHVQELHIGNFEPDAYLNLFSRDSDIGFQSLDTSLAPYNEA